MIGPSQVAYKANLAGIEGRSRKFLEQEFNYLRNVPQTVPEFYEKFNRNIKQVVSINQEFN